MQKDIFNSVSKIKFKNIDNLDVAEALAPFWVSDSLHNISLFKVLKCIISLSFFSKTKIEGEGDAWFFFTPSYGSRTDLLNDFNRVLSCVEHAKTFVYEKKFEFSPQMLKYIPLYFTWVNQMRKQELSLKESMYLAAQIGCAYMYLEEVKLYALKCKNLPKLVVTFCDVHTVDYFVTAYFNSLNVKTATLQHAVFEHNKYGWAYKFSHSKYFLGVSEVAMHEAELSGMNLDKFILLGPMKYIGMYMKDSNKKCNQKIMGVALSGPPEKKNNIVLLEYAKILSEKYDYKVLVRLHPALNISDYEPYLKNHMVIDDCDTVIKFGDQCDFVIMGATNVFADLIAMNMFAFRMVIENDFFSCVEDFKFVDFESLEKMIVMLEEKHDEMHGRLQVVREKVCPTWDIKKAYKNFFDRETMS